ncbi:ROK family protein [Aestuariivirga litoralis]|uniref:ROK family protein n=1 Tax=Aestuariivirga litoralis TaxID=2650924 RepID=UPI0018C5E080|nr:ROK family protein [Aestuariivirga litoralis]MBG1232879.1 ROK family protein [Aestuariivirga litoralis]
MPGPDLQRRIGIDIGGTKIDAIVFDSKDQIIFEKRADTPRTYEAMVNAVAALVRDAGEGSVGIGAPGSAHPGTGIWRNANFTPANGKPMQRDLEAVIGRVIRIENDANCFALSEARDGAGAGFKTVAFYTLGTGLGGGLVVNGEIIRGANAEAAEFGHTGLPWMDEADWPPVPCFCGKAGCAEMYVSGTGLIKDYKRVVGQELSGPEIIAKARAGEPPAVAALKRLQIRFARICANLLNMVDPDVFVMGGGMSSLPELVEELPPLIARYTFSGEGQAKVVRAQHGGNSGVRGAARLWG